MPNRYMDVLDYSEVITARLTKKQLARFREHARQAGISQSELIRQWIETADLLPHIPVGVCEKLRKIARGRRGQTARKLIEGVLRREWEWKLGWR